MDTAARLEGLTKAKTNADGYGHAVVVGAGMAGILAARVLTDHFQAVTLVERDRFPEGSEHRRGVPQGRHVHVLLMRGQLVLEQLFPGLVAELSAAGAQLLDVGADIPLRIRQGWGLRFTSGVTLLAGSRGLLEGRIRRRLAALPGFSMIEEATVTGLIPTAAGNAVRGVRIRRGPTNGEERGPEEQLEADLVVDASGRGSRVPQWLETLGYPRPPETVLDAFVGYATRVYRRKETGVRDWKAMMVRAAPPDLTRSGILLPVEDDRWILSVAGLGGDYPPTEEPGFSEFVRSLPAPAIYETVRDAEPIGPILGQRATQNRRRQFELLPSWPDGLVVLGDAVCAFNPVFGQGMTTAALSALLLDASLRRQVRHDREHLTGLGSQFQKRLARLNRNPWNLATSQDSKILEMLGAPPPSRRIRWLRRYLEQVTILATRRPGVARTLLQVITMVKPPPALFRPGILGPALIGLAGDRKSSAGPPEELDSEGRHPELGRV
jgi:flavin-dependent dehydrogenase